MLRRFPFNFRCGPTAASREPSSDMREGKKEIRKQAYVLRPITPCARVLVSILFSCVFCMGIAPAGFPSNMRLFVEPISHGSDFN